MHGRIHGYAAFESTLHGSILAQGGYMFLHVHRIFGRVVAAGYSRWDVEHRQHYLRQCCAHVSIEHSAILNLLHRSFDGDGISTTVLKTDRKSIVLPRLFFDCAKPLMRSERRSSREAKLPCDAFTLTFFMKFVNSSRTSSALELLAFTERITRAVE